ncbi:MAG: HDOD domain-containing protein [Gammaproteobacteria bacterium]|nr:HDOD domain-containing protein [Gammaproteobacteria bacterium]
MDQIVKQDSSPKRMRDKAKQLLQEIDVEQLPTLPNILLSLLKTCHDVSETREQLANHIDKDPALCVRLISICQHNTGRNDPSETTAQKLQQLDDHTLTSLAITSTAQQHLSPRHHQARNSKEQTQFLKRHWQQALLCATIAKAIAKQCHYQYPEEAYTAGLLHNIGQLVLHCAYPDIYATLNTHNDGKVALHELENNEFACNYLYLGAELLNLYHLSSFLSDSILYHLEPIDRVIDAHPLVKIVHFANQLSNTDFNHQKKQSNDNIFDHASQLFSFERATVIKILSDTNDYLNNCAVEFEIDLDDDNNDETNARHIEARAEYVQAQLDEQVRYITLLDGLHQHLSRVNEDTELFQPIQQFTNLLFGIDQNIVFLCETDNTHVRAIATKGNQHLADLQIPLKENRSIITDCLLEKKALHSFSHQYNKLSIVDQQLISSTAKQGLVCLPLISHQEIIGVLTLAVDRQQQATLWKQLPLLNRFSQEIAHTFHCRHSNSTKTSTGWGEFEPHIREVIHEVGNPLSIINNYLEILSLKLEADHQAHTDIQTIKSEIHRVGDILQRLKSPEPCTGLTTKVDINGLLTKLTKIFKTSILATHDIQIKLDLDQRLTPITCNPDALNQIYTNLIKNAAEALPEKGQIMVYTQGQVNVDGKTYIEISIADNGPGIRSEVLSQLFKPVQTDKGKGHAGIGLSIVKKLVAELNGSISCRCNNKGTSFQILLPNK